MNRKGIDQNDTNQSDTSTMYKNDANRSHVIQMT